jgi:hypothetical protein
MKGDIREMNDFDIIELRLKFLKILLSSNNPDICLIDRVRVRLIEGVKEIIENVEDINNG